MPVGAHPGPVVVVGAHVPAILIEVERVPGEGETVMGSSLREPLDGGKATHQAIVAARLGSPAALVTALGDDERSRWWRSWLEREGLDLSWTVNAPGPLDTGVILLPPSGVPAIVSVAGRSLALDAAAVERAEPVIAMASVVVCQLESPQDGVRAAFEIARGHGVPTILNPAPATDLDPAILALTDYLVPNEHEAARLLGRAGSLREMAAALCDRHGLGSVIITAGADGAHVATAGGRTWHEPAPIVDAVDTTGAGDAFVGTLAVMLRVGVELEAAARAAVAVASLSVRRSGSIPSFPTLAELHEAGIELPAGDRAGARPVTGGGGEAR